MNICRLPLTGLALVLIIALISCDRSHSSETTLEKAHSNLKITPTSTSTEFDIRMFDDRLIDPDIITRDRVTPTPQTSVVPVSIKFDNSGPWINTNPFTTQKQGGEVILVDFWTYSCVNCIRTLPYLREWHSKYKNKGLTIVGVHSPEFEFEKIYENVSDSVKEFEIEYPIVLDNDLKIWKSFENRYWPAKYLFDKDGVTRYMHFGEGQYQETESVIRTLLTEMGADLSELPLDDTIQSPTESSEIPRSEQTMELYLGTDRNYAFNFFHPSYIGNEQYYENIQSPNWQKETNFKNLLRREKDKIYLTGTWVKEKENILQARDTDDYIDFLTLIFSAAEVNTVMGEYKEPYKVMITLEDNPLIKSEAGMDVHFDQSGNSFILVDESRMYNIIKLTAFDTRDLKLSSKSKGFSVYSFTFGSDPRGQ